MDQDEPYRKVSMSNMDDKNLRETVQGGWIAWLQHYFVTAWIPQAGDTNQVQTRKDSQGNYIIGFTGPAVTVPAGARARPAPRCMPVRRARTSWKSCRRACV